jgi:pimeloyl-ACP methyl ester carboxylesterase
MNFLVQQQPAYAYTGGKPFDRAKPTILFIHGAANDHSVWTFQVRYFANHGWNALAVDLPGHGRTFGEAKKSVAAYADWVVNLLDNGAITKAALVGHSMGSLIAVEITRRYRERVSHMALLGTSLPMPVGEALLSAASENSHDAFDMVNIWGHSPQARWGKSPSPGTSLMMSNKRLLEKSRKNILANDLTACREYVDTSIQIDPGVPSLVVAGARDLMTSPKASAAVAHAINARFSLIENVGHAIMQEAPSQLIEELKALLQI